MIGEDHLHIIEKGAVQEQSLVVHRTLMFQPQKKHYQYKPKTFCLKDSNHLIVDVQKPKYFVFLRKTPWSVASAF